MHWSNTVCSFNSKSSQIYVVLGVRSKLNGFTSVSIPVICHKSFVIFIRQRTFVGVYAFIIMSCDLCDRELFKLLNNLDSSFDRLTLIIQFFASKFVCLKTAFWSSWVNAWRIFSEDGRCLKSYLRIIPTNCLDRIPPIISNSSQ